MIRAPLTRVAGIALLATHLIVLSFPARAACPPGSDLIGPRTDYVTDLNPNGIAIADFDHDGALDLAVTNSYRISVSPTSPGTLSILRGLKSGGVPTGAFGPATNLACGISPLDLEAVSINGDEWTDLLVAGWGEDRLLVFLGQSGGTFAPPVRYPAGSKPHQLACADFNEDGILDVAAANNGTPGVSVLLGRGSGGVGDGTFGPPQSYPLRVLAVDVDTGDLNGDGILDLVVSQTFNGEVAVSLGRGAGGVGDGTFLSASYVGVGQQPYWTMLAELNADGHPDLLIGEGNSAGLRVALGQDSAPWFAPATTIGQLDNVGRIHVTDVDKDEVPDVVVCYSTGNRLEILRGVPAGGVGSGTFVRAGSEATGNFPAFVTSADFDQDGHLDIVVANYFANSISVFRGTCLEPPPPPPSFQLTGVRDVPADQGGRVFVTWRAHPRDVTGGSIRQYRVWRRIVAPEPNRVRTVRATPAATPAGVQTWYWEALATLPAQRLANYGYTAATTRDSLASGNPYTAFFVSALTDTFDAFYDTAVDSGYSVDNLPPDTPLGFRADATGGGVTLSWSPVEAVDLECYTVHRGSVEDFVPSTANQIASTTEPGWTDAELAGGWYKLVARDRNGNASAAVVTYSAGLLDAGPHPPALALRGATPNPSNGRHVVVRLTLPTATPARLELFDTAGRRVWSHTLAERAGEHSVVLGGTPLPAGLFHVRLAQGGRVVHTRIAVLP